MVLRSGASRPAKGVCICAVLNILLECVMAWKADPIRPNETHICLAN